MSMEKWLLVVVAIVLLALAGLFILGFRSQSGEAPGLSEGRLKPCPGTSNCVCSEFEPAGEQSIEPLVYPPAQPDRAMAELAAVVRDMGGVVQRLTDDYLAAVFVSSLFGFTDDLEARIDSERHVIHLRSASRVGRSDLGVNRKRIERLRQKFQARFP